MQRLIVGVLLLALAVSVLPPAGVALADERLFPQTGFRVDDDHVWSYMQSRGGIANFGYPVSRVFTLNGLKTQLFQRQALQVFPDGSVQPMNLLDPGLMPYTQINGSTFPAVDEALKAATPKVGEPDYDTRIVAFVRANAPDEWNRLRVNFGKTFFSAITCDQVARGGACPEELLPLFNLALWGAPISGPAFDPNNRNFVYQRFQRGILHYDATTGATQGILLGDWLKSLITGQGLPPDLAQQASSSKLLRQYAAGQPGAIARPAELPGSDLANAFAPVGTTEQSSPPSSPYAARSPEYGMNIFVWGHPDTTGRDLGRLAELHFGWQKTLFQWREIEGACKGCFDWRESDRVIQASSAAGVKVLARLDFQPKWARADGAHNGPPDNYQDFADFVSALVSRYKQGSPIGRLHAIEIWNEVNLAREWGNKPINQAQAADYVRLLKLAYQAAKAADSSITVVTSGLSPTGWNDDTARPDDTYLQWLYNAGLKGNYDVLGAHGNAQAPDPEAAPNSDPRFPHPSFYFRRVEQLRDLMVKNGDAAKQVWLLEFGWTSDTIHPTYSWYAVSEDRKAQNIVRAFQYARQSWAPWIGVMMLWTLPDPSWSVDREEAWWAIADPSGAPRPAYNALLQARYNGTLP
ncbi:MAG: hypothetical protein HY690_00660 [Chloroflexi bacterium]|nr:hypothetical protein [Chloroflexota bacterium]